MATFAALDATGTSITLQAPNANGRAAAASSRPIALSVEDLAQLAAIVTALGAAPAQVGGKIDTVIVSTATDIGAYVGFSGAVFSTTSGSATVTLTTPPTSGQIVAGDVITANGVPTGATLVLASGTINAANSTYTLTISGSAVNATAAASVQATGVGVRILTAANLNRRGFSVQNQTLGTMWLNGVTLPTGTFHDLQITSGNYFETKDSHVGTGQIAVLPSVPGGVYARTW